jgi:hypothetical protein
MTATGGCIRGGPEMVALIMALVTTLPLLIFNFFIMKPGTALALFLLMTVVGAAGYDSVNRR